MNNLLDQFNKEYDFLYEHLDKVAGYSEAVQWFDDNLSRPEVKKYAIELAKQRNDIITSDREAAAFAFTCEVLDIG